MPPITDNGTSSPDDQPHHSIRGALYKHGQSSLQRYSELVIGRRGLISLLKHECITLLFGSLPGALGLVLRRFFYPFLVGGCGRNVIWGRNIVIRHGYKIRLGDDVVLDDGVVLDAKGETNHGITLADGALLSRGTILSCKNGDIQVGQEVSFGIHSLVHAVEGSNVAIGDKCVLAAYVYLVGGGTYHLERLDIPIKDQGTYARGGIEIAANVWLGAKVQVLDGVTISTGSVAAAGAVVHRDVPANVIVAGVPARIIKKREATPIT